MDFYLSQIVMWACNFTPRGFAACEGQQMSIATNSALFSLLGTTFGGNGQTTFGLPDFRGRGPMHFGTGPSLPTYVLGQSGGTTSVTLTPVQMPVHTHSATATSASTSTSTSTSTLYGETAQADARNPLGKMLATPPAGAQVYADPIAADNKAMAPDSVATTTTTTTGTTTNVTVQPAGGSQPFSIMQPFLAVNICICVQGIFPSRN